jgi:putative Ca2+/H+ antiporter (TMEM165/GDT1 family)
MDWKVLGATFVSIFLAELGDKTQLATMTLSAGSRSRLAVFIGASLALVLTSLIGVLTGDLVARVVSPVWLQRIAGAVFIVLGVVYLVTAAAPPPPAVQ